MITQTRLKELMHYDPLTGVFVWLGGHGNREAGTVAGTRTDAGYTDVQLDGCKYKAHRLAFLYMYGAVPEEVDHINHVKDDNRWANLRPVDRTTNAQNLTQRADNTTGVTGVIWREDCKKWAARIGVDGRRVHLGCFGALSDAVSARLVAERNHGFHLNHGASL